MDVNKIGFYPLLLDILTDISESHFVAIDLELSGVPSKQIRGETGKPSLQQRYLETKEAAERYQILQIGVTCVTQDVVNGTYVLQPYNFDLNPLIEERGLDIERIFSFQSGAAEFLLKVGFDISKPFKHGVPYLSRLESKEARDKHAQRQDKTAIADIQIKPTEVESLAFVASVRETINTWLANRDFDTPDYLNIPDAFSSSDNTKSIAQQPEELSRFEKRLVHQLVRAEYPQLVTLSKRTFIQIIRYDKEREDKIAADRRREMNERVNRQKGFRWIIEALLGSDLSKLDLRESARDPTTGEPVFADMDEFRNQFQRAATIMRGNPRMLVGHNCFLDLIYIYRTFIGVLPDTVTEFQEKLHKLWPRIVDTKYMSTHDCGDISPVSSLEQIAHQLSSQEKPILRVTEEHQKYEHVAAFHEAGYDSYLTAQIAVRLSSKLQLEGGYVDVPTPEMKKTSIKGPDPQADGFVPSNPDFRWKRRGDPTVAGTSGADDPFVFNPKDLKHRHVDLGAQAKIPGGMPRLNSDFWRVYGNKLRVFGTEESVCVLDAGETWGGGSSEEEESVEEEQGGVQVECP